MPLFSEITVFRMSGYVKQPAWHHYEYTGIILVNDD